MVGLDVGDKTLFGRKQLDALGKNRGPMSDFTYKVGKFLVELAEKFGASGTPMYDPLAVGVAIDSTLVTAPAMHVEVETRGEFTRGETVANRRNEVERNVLHHSQAGSGEADRYMIEGLDKVEPNAKVCIEVQAEKFLQMFVSRIQDK
jgi:inosine-uridine nucleoside N-ribohydrolase